MELLRPLNEAEYPAQTITLTTSTSTPAATANYWNSGPQGVLVWSTVPCYVSVGADPTASTSSTPVPANVPIPFYVHQQSSSRPWRVSVLGMGTAGTVYCKPMNIR